MSDYRYVFLGTQWNPDLDQTELQCYSDENNQIRIEFKRGGVHEWMTLDVPTAIKFAKTLRHEINKAKEVYNEAD